MRSTSHQILICESVCIKICNKCSYAIILRVICKKNV